MARKRGDTEKFGKDGLGIFMGADDWKEAMGYAKFEFKDIKRVLLADEGEPEGNDWQLVVELKDGRFGWLSAWCDASGWGCQEGGKSGTCKTAEKALAAMNRYTNQGATL